MSAITIVSFLGLCATHVPVPPPLPFLISHSKQLQKFQILLNNVQTVLKHKSSSHNAVFLMSPLTLDKRDRSDKEGRACWDGLIAAYTVTELIRLTHSVDDHLPLSGGYGRMTTVGGCGLSFLFVLDPPALPVIGIVELYSGWSFSNHDLNKK